MNQRFIAPNQGEQYPSEYDMPSWVIQDLQSRGVDVFDSYDLNLDSAGTLNINKPGMGFVMYGYNRSDLSKYSDAFAAVAINGDGNDLTVVFPCKTGRGYIGSFTTLSLSWPNNPNGSGFSAKFYVFKSSRVPWQGGLEAT